MSSVDLVVQRETDHDFSALLGGFFIGTRTFGPIVIEEIETASFREGTLEVLVGSATVPSSCSITIDAFAVARTRDDPGTLYTDAQSLATVAISASATEATLVRAAFAANFGARIAVMITASVDGFAIGGTLKSTFQINVSLKNTARRVERGVDPRRRLVHRRSEGPMAMKPRIVNVAALVHGPRPVANNVAALLSGGQPQKVTNVAALLNGGKPQTIQQSNVAALVRRPGMPEPLTASKSSKPCCEDCADAAPGTKPCAGGRRAVVPQTLQTNQRVQPASQFLRPGQWGRSGPPGYRPSLQAPGILRPLTLTCPRTFNARQQACVQQAWIEANRMPVNEYYRTMPPTINCNAPPVIDITGPPWKNRFRGYFGPFAHGCSTVVGDAFGPPDFADADIIAFREIMDEVADQTVGDWAAVPCRGLDAHGNPSSGTVDFLGYGPVTLDAPTTYLSRNCGPVLRAQRIPNPRAETPRYVQRILSPEQIVNVQLFGGSRFRQQRGVPGCMRFSTMMPFSPSARCEPFSLSEAMEMFNVLRDLAIHGAADAMSLCAAFSATLTTRLTGRLPGLLGTMPNCNICQLVLTLASSGPSTASPGAFDVSFAFPPTDGFEFCLCDVPPLPIPC